MKKSTGRPSIREEGNRYKSLTVIREAEYNPREKLWMCRCDCGNEKIVAGSALRSGRTGQCEECYRNEVGRRSITHGHTSGGFSSTYHSWASMRTRVTNTKRKQSKDYLGRGITSCESWRKFSNFLSDMGERPEGTTLDRINNDGNYEPSNCRWADSITQNNNRRKV